MAVYATILSGDETLAAEILTTPTAGRFTVRFIDQEASVEAGSVAVVGNLQRVDIDRAFREANAFVTGTPVTNG